MRTGGQANWLDGLNKNCSKVAVRGCASSFSSKRGFHTLLTTVLHVLSQPEGATPGALWAMKFIDFVAFDEGQRIVQDYGKDRYGEGLYNDATDAREYEDGFAWPWCFFRKSLRQILPLSVCYLSF
jgi:hypothetical protein